MPTKTNRTPRKTTGEQNVVAAADRLQSIFPQSVKDVETLVVHVEGLETDLEQAETALKVERDRHQLELSALKKEHEEAIRSRDEKIQKLSETLRVVKRHIDS